MYLANLCYYILLVQVNRIDALTKDITGLYLSCKDEFVLRRPHLHGSLEVWSERKEDCGKVGVEVELSLLQRFADRHRIQTEQRTVSSNLHCIYCQVDVDLGAI